MKKNFKIASAAACLLGTLSLTTQAAPVTFSTWTSNDGDSANYIVTLDDSNAGFFDITLTIDPWNAEALGLFLDFGASDYAGTGTVTNVTTSPYEDGTVTFVASDTTSDSCGAGCNLAGLNPSLVAPDGEWELVFRLGEQGYQGIQTFSWTVDDGGLSLEDLVAAGARAQVMCSGDALLPDDQSSCGGSDKSYSSDPDGPTTVPEPSSIALLALGLAGVGLSRRKLAIRK